MNQLTRAANRCAIPDTVRTNTSNGQQRKQHTSQTLTCQHTGRDREHVHVKVLGVSALPDVIESRTNSHRGAVVCVRDNKRKTDRIPVGNVRPVLAWDPQASAKSLEEEVLRAELDLKKRWFAHNGGKSVVEGSHQKPLFFDAVLNYVDLPMEKLQEKAGIAPAEAKASPVVEKKTLVERKVDTQREENSAAPAQESQGMLGSLLGGWWGRK